MVFRWLFGITVTLLVVLLGLSVIQGVQIPSQSGISCADCNVIIVGIDTLRADRVHAFGYKNATTPNLDALASKSLSFTNAISASSWTVPSFMSIMTGVYPSAHKVVNKYVVFNAQEQTLSNLEALSPEIMTLAEVMKEAGYATGGFTGDAGVSGQFGYKQGFDVYTDEKAFGGLNNSAGHALSWLDGLSKGTKFFMFYHGYDLHGQFDISKDKQLFVPKNYAGPYTGSALEEATLREDQLAGPLSFTASDIEFWSGLYDSKIHAADAEFGDFLKELEKRGLLEKTIIIVLSDHGEEYFEHEGIDHGQSLYDELVRVPLIVHVPDSAGGQKISAQVSTMDVAPTLFQILNLTPDSKFTAQQQGRSLVPYFSEASSGHDVFIETDYRDFIHLRGIRTADGWKYIFNFVNGAEQLYDLKADPVEKNNLVGSNPAKAADLKTKLFAHIRDDLDADPSIRFDVGCLPVYPTECK